MGITDADLDALADAGYAYFRLLRRIHLALQPQTYIEIGVRNGGSLRLARPETLVLGIDPEADITVPLPTRAKVFRETSDEFFSRDVMAELEGQPLDLSFIDGMHHFEFAVRDFVNLERLSHPESTVLIHDCYPIDAETAARDCTTFLWSGDVWKLIVCLKRYRPDLDVTTVDVSPTGLAIVTNLDPTSTVLAERVDDLYREFVPLAFDDGLGQNKAAALNRVDDGWDTVQTLLRPGLTRGGTS